MGVESSEDISLTQMRKSLLQTFCQQVNAPHFYLTVEINMDKAIAARVGVNEVSQ